MLEMSAAGEGDFCTDLIRAIKIWDEIFINTLRKDTYLRILR